MVLDINVPDRGESTRGEIKYADALGLPIQYDEES